jgi:MFS family permease
LVGYRLAMLARTGLATAAFQCANSLMSLSFVAAALIALSRLATLREHVSWTLVPLLLTLAAFSLVAAWLVKHQGWRRWYIVAAIAEAALAFITMHVLSTLTLWEKLEIFSVVAGVALLAVGHVGWSRERDQHEDLVSFSLLWGSLLAGLPLAIAVLIHRCQTVPQYSPLNELGMLIIGIALLTTGFAFQIRSTTIVGAGMMLVYLLSLVFFIHMPELAKTAAFWLTLGGATVFALGILLSVYRDRLLALPDKARRREGVFRVLGWR